MLSLTVRMNGYQVGTLKKGSTGAHTFSYASDWIENSGARPISMSMPLRVDPYTGAEVYNFFDNLLPDSSEVRERIVARHGAVSTQPFDLLSEVGKDIIGALQITPETQQPIEIRTIDKIALTPKKIEKILNGYLSDIPLGMLNENDDFRISIAGAQEKTALLKLKGKWYLPKGTTPTTHILKLPVGMIKSHEHTIDLTDSCENELVCMRLARAYGLDAAECDILNANKTKALAVERFDRKMSSDGQWIMRLPQEDFCQVFGLPPGKKYESDGGVGIKSIMNYLLGSSRPEIDRVNFMKSQVLFWLLAASDGHAKNFSVHIEPNSGFHMTPLYDIISAYPIIGGRGLNERDVKMAMGLHGTNGKGGRYGWHDLFRRHFISTAKAVGFDTQVMDEILIEFFRTTKDSIKAVQAKLPKSVPERISGKIFEGVSKRAKRLE